MEEEAIDDEIDQIQNWFDWADRTIKRMAKILYANELISIGALAELLDVSVEEATEMVKPKLPKEPRPDRLVD